MKVLYFSLIVFFTLISILLNGIIPIKVYRPK